MADKRKRRSNAIDIAGMVIIMIAIALAVAGIFDGLLFGFGGSIERGTTFYAIAAIAFVIEVILLVFLHMLRTDDEPKSSEQRKNEDENERRRAVEESEERHRQYEEQLQRDRPWEKDGITEEKWRKKESRSKALGCVIGIIMFLGVAIITTLQMFGVM